MSADALVTLGPTLQFLSHSATGRPPSHRPSSLCVSRAADWKLDAPDWTGRMRVTARGKVAYVKLEDKVSGERGHRADRTVPLFTGAVAVVNHLSVYFSSPLSPSVLLISSKVTQQ